MLAVGKGAVGNGLPTSLLTSLVSLRLPRQATSVFGLLSSDLPQFNSASKNALSPLSGKLFIATYKSNGYANVFN